MVSPKIKRKKYVIAARFQFRYIIYILLFLYIGAAIAGYTVYYSAWTTLGEKLANVYPRGRLIYIFKQANITLLFRLLLISPLFIFIGIILSHRIAGPIYRIGKYVEQLMQGDYAHGLTLRKRDEFKPLALKMSQLCYKLREDEEKRKHTVKEIESILKSQNVSHDVLVRVDRLLRHIEYAHVHESDAT